MNANDSMIVPTDPRIDSTRVIRAPRGTELSCKSWLTEAACNLKGHKDRPSELHLLTRRPDMQTEPLHAEEGGSMLPVLNRMKR